jgi:hypothetical protein
LRAHGQNLARSGTAGKSGAAACKLASRSVAVFVLLSPMKSAIEVRVPYVYRAACHRRQTNILRILEAADADMKKFFAHAFEN